MPTQLFQERKCVAEVVVTNIGDRAADRGATGIFVGHGPPKWKWESAQNKAGNDCVQYAWAGYALACYARAV